MSNLFIILISASSLFLIIGVIKSIVSDYKGFWNLVIDILTFDLLVIIIEIAIETVNSL